MKFCNVTMLLGQLTVTTGMTMRHVSALSIHMHAAVHAWAQHTSDFMPWFVVCFRTNWEVHIKRFLVWVACQTAVYVIVQILKPAEKKQKFAVTGAGNRPGTPPRAGAKAGVAPAAPAAAPAKA